MKQLVGIIILFPLCLVVIYPVIGDYKCYVCDKAQVGCEPGSGQLKTHLTGCSSGSVGCKIDQNKRNCASADDGVTCYPPSCMLCKSSSCNSD